MADLIELILSLFGVVDGRLVAKVKQMTSCYESITAYILQQKSEQGTGKNH